MQYCNVGLCVKFLKKRVLHRATHALKYMDKEEGTYIVTHPS